MIQNTGVTHHLTLPDAGDEVVVGQEPAPLRVLLDSDHYGVAFQAKDTEDLCGCDVFIESYNGRLVLHASTAGSPDSHKYHLVLGRVVDGLLVPYEPSGEEPAELEIDPTI